VAGCDVGATRVRQATCVSVAATPVALPYSSLCENCLQNGSQQIFFHFLAIFTDYVHLPP